MPCGTSPALIEENIEAALAAGDIDLAASFVELAREKNIALGDELSKRVREAVAEENSTSGIAKRFAVGFVTGNSDDIASLSGTVAGDLIVWGDIRDVVREGKHLAMGEETDHLILGPCHRRPCRDGGDLRLGRRRDAAPRGPVAGQGYPQGGTAERGAA